MTGIVRCLIASHIYHDLRETRSRAGVMNLGLAFARATEVRAEAIRMPRAARVWPIVQRSALGSGRGGSARVRTHARRPG